MATLEPLLVGRQLTRQQILAAWPEAAAPSGTALWRWLQRALDQNLVSQEGSGARGDPRRYWLTGQTASWNPDPWEILGMR